MRKIRMKAATMAARLCGIGLTILGLSACDDNKCMYGPPYGSFEVKGEVTEEDGVPVEGAEIQVKTFKYGSPDIVIKDQTEADGKYRVRETQVDIQQIRVVCTPPKDSGLDSDSTEINLTFKGGDGEWYYGEATETVNFSLKKKKQ